MSEEFEYHEYRPGRYVKITNARVHSRALPGEIILNKPIYKTNINIGIIQVSIAMAALSGILVTLTEVHWLRVILYISAFLFIDSIYLFLPVYIFSRSPIAISEYIDRHATIDIHNFQVSIKTLLWVSLIFPIRMILQPWKLGTPDITFNHIKEAGYMFLFWGVVLISLIFIAFLIFI